MARAVKSNMGRVIGKALKEQAISSGTHLISDLVAGNNLKQGLAREVGNVRQRAALGIQPLKNTQRGYESDEDESETEYEQNPSIKRKIITKKKTLFKPQVKNIDMKGKIEDLNIEIEDLKIKIEIIQDLKTKIEIQDLKTKIKKYREDLKQRRLKGSKSNKRVLFNFLSDDDEST